MKTSIPTEEIQNPVYAFFDETEFAPITVREDIAFEIPYPAIENAFLDNLTPGIKWIFLYVPGILAIHFQMMGMVLTFFYRDWSLGLMAGVFGITIFSIFMVMLGIGKLNDLKYLRVVAAAFAISGLASIFYSLLIIVIPGDYFGTFTLMTLPLTLLAGYVVKRYTDGLEEPA